MTRRRAQQDGPSLFDVAAGETVEVTTTVEIDTTGEQRVVGPTRIRRTPPVAAPVDDEFTRRAAEAKARWAESTRRARARFENPQGDDRP